MAILPGNTSETKLPTREEFIDACIDVSGGDDNPAARAFHGEVYDTLLDNSPEGVLAFRVALREWSGRFDKA